MDFMEVMKGLLVFFQDNILITIVLVCVLLFLLYWKPKLFLIILSIILLLVGILYIILDVTSTGVPYKQNLIQEKDIL